MKVIKFETLYRKIKKSSSNDLDLFKNFVFAITKKEPINIWAFQQNELKTKQTGKLSLKALCLSFYLNYFELTDW